MDECSDLRLASYLQEVAYSFGIHSCKVAVSVGHRGSHAVYCVHALHRLVQLVVVHQIRFETLNSVGIHYLQVSTSSKDAPGNLPLLKQILDDVASDEASRPNQ